MATGLVLALFLAGQASSQGIGNSKSYDQNSYDWMGTPVVSSGQTNAIIPPTFRINTPIHNIFCSLARVALGPSPESRSALSVG